VRFGHAPQAPAPATSVVELVENGARDRSHWNSRRMMSFAARYVIGSPCQSPFAIFAAAWSASLSFGIRAMSTAIVVSTLPDSTSSCARFGRSASFIRE